MDEKAQPPIEIPSSALSPEILAAITESFILREGTDYGAREVELTTKKEQVQKQIFKGQVKIVFDPHTESVNLMTTQDWERAK